MSSSLSSLVENLAADEIKNIFSYVCEDCTNKLNYLRFKDNMLFKCFQCNEYLHDFINKFKNTYEFCNKDIGKDFIKDQCLIEKLFIVA